MKKYFAIILTYIILTKSLTLSHPILEEENENNLCKDHKGSIEYFLQNNLNYDIDPCENFYDFVCGKYNEKKDYFEYVQDKVDNELKSLLIASARDSTVLDKLRFFYSDCIQNSAKIKRKQIIKIFLNELKKSGFWTIGNFPLNQTMSSNEQRQGSFHWLRMVAFLRLYGVDGIFFRTILKTNTSNFTESNLYIVIPEFTSISINDLLGTSESSEMFRFLYKMQIENLIYNLGYKSNESKTIATDILDFEIKIANFSRIAEIVEDENPKKIELNDFISIIQKDRTNEWNEYFNLLLSDKGEEWQTSKHHLYLFAQNEYLELLQPLIESTSEFTVLHYILMKYFLYFDIGLRQSFDEDEKTNTCFKDAMKYLSPLLEHFYLTKVMGLNNLISKMNSTRKIADNIRKHYRKILSETSLFDDVTKITALKKMDSMSFQIGYADEKLLSTEYLKEYYSNLELYESKNYYENLLEAAHFKGNKEFRLFSQAGDDLNSNFPSHKINAYYILSKNSLIIPAAFLQKPFFSEGLPESWNYGAFGTIIGHEMSHAFDFDGRNFNEHGNIGKWFSATSLFKYLLEGKCFIRKYNTFESNIIDTSGFLKMDENFADTSGVNTSLKAFSDEYPQTKNNIVASEFKFNRTIMNLQLFFISFANLWCEGPPESAMSKHSVDHPSYRYRVIGSLSNFPEFAESFQCSSESLMNKLEKCRSW